MKKSTYQQSRKGFTLIELIIVIAIIGLLATLGIGGYQNVQVSSRNTKRQADLREMKKALAAFYADNNNYPSTVVGSTRQWWGTCSGSIPSGWATKGDSGSGGYVPNLAPAYIDKLPRDPRENQTNASSPNTTCQTQAQRNCYLYSSNGSDYKLYAHCTPEETVAASDAFYDGSHNYAYAVWSSPTGRSW